MVSGPRSWPRGDGARRAGSIRTASSFRSFRSSSPRPTSCSSPRNRSSSASPNGCSTPSRASCWPIATPGCWGAGAVIVVWTRTSSGCRSPADSRWLKRWRGPTGWAPPSRNRSRRSSRAANTSPSRSLSFTCIGSPIRHPITHHVEGGINIACRYKDANSLVLPMVLEMALGHRGRPVPPGVGTGAGPLRQLPAPGQNVGHADRLDERAVHDDQRRRGPAARRRRPGGPVGTGLPGHRPAARAGPSR